MSIHSPKSRNRHPDAERLQYPVAHITFEVSRKNGTFGLFPGLAENAKERRPLFTGFVEKGMGTQLRKLAHLCDEIEAEL